MKNLSNYISYNSKIYETYLLDKLCIHCSLEFKWENQLDPRFLFYQSIYESLGKFNNAGKTVKHICDELKNNFNSQKIDCKEDNVYFEYIDIDLHKEGFDEASYLEYKNNTLFIEIYCVNIDDFEENIDNYAKLILHELLHGYEDYNRIKNGHPSIIDINDLDYQRSIKGLNSLSNIRCNFSRCKYFLNKQEQNAYFSSLEDDIKKLIKTNNYYLDKFDYNKFKNDLKSTGIWEIYYDLYNFINQLIELNDINKQKVVEFYNDFFKTNKTFNQIIKELKIKWRKFESKFNQLVPKILCDNIQIKESRNFSIMPNQLNRTFEF